MLPRIRRRVDRDLARRGAPRAKVLATVVRLLETTLIRVGNDEYARENGSFGLTTMRDRHVGVNGNTVRFRFRGKSGVARDIDLQSPRLARIVKRCQDLPGQELFQYLDEDGAVRDIGSADVNAYLREISARKSAPRSFAPGRARRLRPGRCKSLRNSIPPPGQNAMSREPSSAWQSDWATPRPSAGSAMSTRP